MSGGISDLVWSLLLVTLEKGTKNENHYDNGSVWRSGVCHKTAKAGQDCQGHGARHTAAWTLRAGMGSRQGNIEEVCFQEEP